MLTRVCRAKMIRKKQLLLLPISALCLMGMYWWIMVPLFTTNMEIPERSRENRVTIQDIDEGTNSLGLKDSIDNDIVSVAKKTASASNRGVVLVTMVNDAYLSFTYSWLCNTKYMNIHKSVLIITTDKTSKEKLEADWPEISVFAMDMSTMSGDQTYSHVGYLKIMIKRTLMINSILQANLEVFVFEVDCLWFSDPTPRLQNSTGFDVLVNPVAERTGIYAGGFLYLFTTDKAKALWNELTKQMLALGERISKLDDKKYISEGENDQQYFSALIVKKYGGIKVKELPLDIYADGKWYSLPEDKRKASKAIIVNNNWALGNAAKIERAKKWKHWFIHDDVKMTCDEELVNKTVKSNS